jgi:hypothetical protein
MRRILLSTLAALTLGGSMAGCFAHEDRGNHDHLYRDRDGREYRHERWHDEDVYRREDGRWYSRRNNDWVIRADVDLH